MTGTNEKAMREASVAELRADCSVANPTLTITSRGCGVDQAIAEALHSERHGSPAASGEFVRTVLVDDIAVKIENPDSVVNALAPLKGAFEQRICGGSRNMSQNWKCDRSCGCHSGTLRRAASVRAGSGASPDAALLFSILSTPAVGPVFMQSTSWGFCLSLCGLMLNHEWGSGPVEASIRLQRKRMRTRSGVEVVLVKPVVRLAGSEARDDSYWLAV